MMLSARQTSILTILKNEGSWTSGFYLASTLNVSTRTIQNDIKLINEMLPRNASIQSNTRKGYLFTGDITSIDHYIHGEQHHYKVVEPKYDRVKQLMMVLMFYNQHCSADQLMQKLYLSRSSINNIIRRAKRVIKRTPNLSFITTYGKGYAIVGSEDAKRNMIVKTLDASTDYRIILNNPRFYKIFEYIELLYPNMAKSLINHHYLLSGDSLKYLVEYIAVSVFRSNEGFVIDDAHLPALTSLILMNDIKAQISKLLGYELSENEIHYIAKKIEELSFIDHQYHKPLYDKEIQDYWKLFSQVVNEKYQYELSYIEDIAHKFNQHVHRMLMRIMAGHTIIGSYTKELANLYPLSWFFLKSSLNDALGFDVPDAEMGYLVGFVNSAIENDRPLLSAVCIGDEDSAILYHLKALLETGLTRFVGSIDVLPKYYFDYAQSSLDYDVIFTTSSLLNHKNVVHLDVLSINKGMHLLERKVEAIYNQTIQDYFDAFMSEVRRPIKIEKVENVEKLKKLINNSIESKMAINDNNEETLIIFTMNNDEEKSIQAYMLQKTINHNHKPIKKIMHINSDNQDRIIFFDFIRDQIMPL